MPTELKMPALSPTMEEGTLAKWLVKEGDTVRSGDLLAEIETDKATMEFEAVDEGTIAKILVAEGSEGVKVGALIALLAGEGEEVSAEAAPAKASAPVSSPPVGEVSRSDGGGQGASAPEKTVSPPEEIRPVSSAADAAGPPPASPTRGEEERVKASPLARRLAEEKGIDLTTITGTGPGGRIVREDVLNVSPQGAAAPQEAAAPAQVAQPAPAPSAPAAAKPEPVAAAPSDIPHETVKLSGMRKTIARRLTESKQTIPHIYLTVDIRLDALLKLRVELNAGLASRGVKLSVNDLLIKALALSLIDVPECNVSFAGDTLVKYSRADISVAVSIPGGLITPIVSGADALSISAISRAMNDLAARAKEGKLQPQEYQGGTASLSNMGMYGIKQFEAVINPPQAMIMAIGAGEKRPFVIDDALQVATIMTATGSFDHRAIDGADGARQMQAFKQLCEAPLGLVA